MSTRRKAPEPFVGSHFPNRQVIPLGLKMLRGKRDAYPFPRWRPRGCQRQMGASRRAAVYLDGVDMGSAGRLGEGGPLNFPATVRKIRPLQRLRDARAVRLCRSAKGRSRRRLSGSQGVARSRGMREMRPVLLCRNFGRKGKLRTDRAERYL